MSAATRAGDTRLAALAARLAARSPAARLGRWQLQCQALQQRLAAAAGSRLQRAASRVEVAARALHAVSPLATLERGFAILTRAGDGALLRSAASLAPGEEIEAQLADGRVRARVLARVPRP
jgi:exodeoxyribonuclease VII large subunit